MCTVYGRNNFNAHCSKPNTDMPYAANPSIPVMETLVTARG